VIIFKILAPMFAIALYCNIAFSPSMIIAQKQNMNYILSLLFVVLFNNCFIVCPISEAACRDIPDIISVLFSIVYLVYLVINLLLSKGKKFLMPNVHSFLKASY
jgi:hypothetical protein